MPLDYVDSHYARTLSESGERRTLDARIETETCIVGGGLAGLSIALGLAERGRKVTVLEARQVGWGASGRNGGFVGPGFACGLDAIARRVGETDAHRLYRLSAEAVDLVRHRIDRYGIDCGPHLDGVVSASWFDQGDTLRRSVDRMNKRVDAGLEYWPRAKVREHYLSRRYFDGMFGARRFQFHPLNYTRGIARAAEGHGAAIYERSAVTAFDLGGDRKRIRTARGEVVADQVVFCCSGYLGWLHPRLALTTLPVATYVVLTEPLGDRLRDAIRAPWPCSDNRLANDYYRPLPDGRLLWGGRVSSFRQPRDLARRMIGDILKVYPQLRGIRAEVAWPGTMGYATHKMPQVGQLSDGVWYSQGYGGHGMNTTAMGGELVAKAIAEGDETWRLLEPFGLPFAGGPLGPAIAQVVYWGYQAQDAWRSWRSRTRHG